MTYAYDEFQLQWLDGNCLEVLRRMGPRNQADRRLRDEEPLSPIEDQDRLRGSWLTRTVICGLETTILSYGVAFTTC